MTRNLSYVPWALFFNVGCDESTTAIDARCEIEIVQPEEVFQRGSNYTLQAYPLSSIVDTTVLINDIEIPVVNLNTGTETCLECSTCREEEFCTTCGFCESCTLDCNDCLHELELNLPIDLQQAPEYLLTVINGFGSSSPTAIEILDTVANE